MRGTGYRPRAPDAAGGITPARAGNRRRRPPSLSRRGDHPRACGEQSSNTSGSALMKGSPPRVRGTDRFKPVPKEVDRITPARAGNSSTVSFGLSSGQDHPRACGEQPFIWTLSRWRRGSPPRVRGTGNHQVQGRQQRGITPARAGNSQSRPRYSAAGGDHPRACGEQFLPPCRYGRLLGSPPRVRGTAVCPWEE